MKKYEISEISKTVTVNGKEITVYRIRALKDFTVEAWNRLKAFKKEIHAGDLGGYVESEENLSQDGNCWIAGNATVCGNASISENAYVGGRSWVVENAKVCGNAKVCVGSRLFGNAEVSGNAWSYGFTTLKDNAKLTGNAHVCSTTIKDNAVVCDNAYIDNISPAISGNKVISGDAKLVFNGLLEFGLDEPSVLAAND
ncbi:MAG: hypothetical protein Q4A25_00900 [Candidatus Saccharibacteria bacterium]|nr:hypothetical protein [Candidatus Saccharibacteria bacterium]